jgi:predicted MFS family arabinose efflux permease
MLAFIMLATFAVFPGMMFECRLIFFENIVNDPSKVTPWTFWAIVMIFNICDTIGKLLVDTKLGNVSDTFAYILSFARLLVMANFFLVKYSVYQSDWFNLTNIILYGLTNGYCMNVIAVKSPKNAPDDKKSTIGIFISVFVIVGIMLGSLAAVFINNK